MEESLVTQKLKSIDELQRSNHFFDALNLINELLNEQIIVDDQISLIEKKISLLRIIKDEALEKRELYKLLNLIITKDQIKKFIIYFPRWIEVADEKDLTAKFLKQCTNIFMAHGYLKQAKEVKRSYRDILIDKKLADIILRENDLEVSDEQLLECALLKNDKLVIEDKISKVILSNLNLEEIHMSMEEVPRSIYLSMLDEIEIGSAISLRQYETIFNALLIYSDDKEILLKISKIISQDDITLRKWLRGCLSRHNSDQEVALYIEKNLKRDNIEMILSNTRTDFSNIGYKDLFEQEIVPMINESNEDKPLDSEQIDYFLERKIDRIILANMPYLTDKQIYDLCTGLSLSHFYRSLIKLISILKTNKYADGKKIDKGLLYLEISAMQSIGSYYDVLTNIETLIQEESLQIDEMVLYRYMQAEALFFLNRKKEAYEIYAWIYNCDSEYRLVRERLKNIEEN